MTYKTLSAAAINQNGLRCRTPAARRSRAFVTTTVIKVSNRRASRRSPGPGSPGISLACHLRLTSHAVIRQVIHKEGSMSWLNMHSDEILIGIYAFALVVVLLGL